MIDDILKIIENEDKKKPFTDEKIAFMLKISRENVTQYRCMKNIPDSRERRKPYLYSNLKIILQKHGKISDRKLTRELNNLGYDISRFAVSKIKKEILGHKEIPDHKNVSEEYIHSTKTREVQTSEIPEEGLSAFKELIGSDGSLKMQISQARAAVLYPPHGLHTLILGPSGVGKSQLAEAMYKFALETGRLLEKNPFIVFNCADYADNPQLLMAQLFGYEKGSFTGAYASKAGLIEKADGGMLFLDEVHRLPSEGQEILFYLLDKGRFRRLGETESMRKSNIMLIAATTENPESSLLLTFRRRIPMAIQLPTIDQRPLRERFHIISCFFKEESFRTSRPIEINSDAVKALMLYNCPGNIGQIRSDIQVACARGLLDTLQVKGKNINIDLHHLPGHVSIGFLKFSKSGSEIEEYTDKDIVVYPDRISRIIPSSNRYVLQSEIYQFIEKRFNELKNQGLSRENIYKIVGNQAEAELRRFANSTKSNTMVSKKELKEIVGEKIVYAVEDAINIASSYGMYTRENFFYSFAIHLSAAYDRFKSGKDIVNPQLENVKDDYAREYEVASIMVDIVNRELEIKLTEDEVGFVAMYLRAFSTTENENQSRVAVLVLTHGHVAQGMAEVVNKLLGVNIAHGVEMDLDEKPENALSRTIDVVKKIDQGKGCLIFIDMGSLVTFGGIITEKTGIPIRTIARVDTVMLLEAVRRVMIPNTTIDNIVDALDEGKTYVGLGYAEVPGHSTDFQKAIVTICITGEGTALKMKQYIENNILGMKGKIKVIPVGVFNQREMEKRLREIRRKNIIAAFVGSINPKVGNIPFISVEEIMGGQGLKKLNRIIGTNIKTENSLGKIMSEDLILCDFNATGKGHVIDKMVAALEEKGYVKNGFMLSVYKRETTASTWISGNIAIPHGISKYVTKPSIAIAKLKNPIVWEGNLKADLIFLIALREDSRDYMYDLYGILRDKGALKALRCSRSPSQIKEIMLGNTISTTSLAR